MVHRTRFKVRAKKGNLKLIFPTRQKKIFLAVKAPALHAKKTFVKKTRKHKVKRVKVKISAKTGKRTTSVVAHLKVR